MAFLSSPKIFNGDQSKLITLRATSVVHTSCRIIIVLHRHVNYTSEYKRQYDRQCRPALALWPGLRFRWLLRRPVKVKSLVCLNQCARKRPSYLCPVIMETSFAVPDPTSVISRFPSLWFLHPFGVPRYARGTGRLISRLCDLRSSLNAHAYYMRAKRTKLRTIHVSMMLSFLTV